ncbi:MAG: flagellar motor protein [Cellvibrionaceae bacterium]
MDKLSFFGVIIGFAALIGGNFLEGGSIQVLLNGPAAIIVLGGTIGAAILQTPRAHLNRAFEIFRWVFHPPQPEFDKGIRLIVGWANAARKDGLLGLENMADNERDVFCRRGLQMLVDGNEPDALRRMMESELLLHEQRDADAAAFYESMGGYAPTIGILGAVIGLIHVMNNLADPSQLGPGIAIAFVATIYGVGFANLLLLPIANKLKLCINEQSHYRSLMVEGVVAIAEGENPKSIELKLNAYLRH